MSLPNYISVFRLALIPLFVAALLLSEPDHLQFRYTAFSLFAIALLSDGIDGYIARHYNMRTKTGAALDPLADKLLMNLAFIFMAVTEPYRDLIPKWLPVLILARDGMITGAIYYISQNYGRLDIRPRFLGKLTTVVEGLTVAAVILMLPFAPILLVFMLLVILASSADYLLQGFTIARTARPRA